MYDSLIEIRIVMYLFTLSKSFIGNWHWVDGDLLLSSSMNLFCTNGSISPFDTFFRTNMNCVIYRMDSCLARYTCQRADVNFVCEKSNILLLH